MLRREHTHYNQYARTASIPAQHMHSPLRANLLRHFREQVRTASVGLHAALIHSQHTCTEWLQLAREGWPARGARRTGQDVFDPDPLRDTPRCTQHEAQLAKSRSTHPKPSGSAIVLNSYRSAVVLNSSAVVVLNSSAVVFNSSAVVLAPKLAPN